MFPFEVDYFARKEHCKDLMDEAACDQLLDEAGLTPSLSRSRKLLSWLEKLGWRGE